MLRKFLTVLTLMSAAISGFESSAGTVDEGFYKNFSDSTLRIDCIFAGGPEGVEIYLSDESKQGGWAGRRSRLKNAPLRGNGEIMVLEPVSGDTLYLNPFSSLFQEWILTPEASETARSFENSFLVPLPNREVVIKIVLRDNRHQDLANMQYLFRPENELVGKRGTTPLPFEYIHQGGSPADAIDVAIVAEGFTEEEMDSFLYHARRYADEILSYEPFSSNKDKFNFVAVRTPSRDSGVTIPLKDQWKDTAFRSHFSTFHSARYLTVPELRKVHQALEGIPYEYILIVVNTSEYGGGGIFNSYQVASADNIYTLPVTVHEFGHSFAGLADEYFYPDDEDDMYPLDVEPWEANITTNVDFDSKWKGMIDPSTPVPTPWKDFKNEGTSVEVKDTPIGLYEGGGYKVKGIYRPTVTCRMRDNHFPRFCPVCETTISDVIEFYTSISRPDNPQDSP